MWTLYERHTCRSRYNGIISISERTRLQGALAVEQEHEPHAAMLLRAIARTCSNFNRLQLRSKAVSGPARVGLLESPNRHHPDDVLGRQDRRSARHPFELTNSVPLGTSTSFKAQYFAHMYPRLGSDRCQA